MLATYFVFSRAGVGGALVDVTTSFIRQLEPFATLETLLGTTTRTTVLARIVAT